MLLLSSGGRDCYGENRSGLPWIFTKKRLTSDVNCSTKGSAVLATTAPWYEWPVSERFVVQVDADQFDRLARPTQPLAGIAELIWSALDAEAETVVVAIDRTELDGVDVVSVTDDGHGMTHDETSRDFRKLGGSWKKSGGYFKSIKQAKTDSRCNEGSRSSTTRFLR